MNDEAPPAIRNFIIPTVIEQTHRGEQIGRASCRERV